MGLLEDCKAARPDWPWGDPDGETPEAVLEHAGEEIVVLVRRDRAGLVVASAPMPGLSVQAIAGRGRDASSAIAALQHQLREHAQRWRDEAERMEHDADLCDFIHEAIER